jgi:acetyl coenzyme A synthetase (ADP forming)-like protein
MAFVHARFAATPKSAQQLRTAQGDRQPTKRPSCGHHLAKMSPQQMPTPDAPPRPLDPLFHPRAVAVIGASRRRGTIGGDLFHNLMSRDSPGAIYPVNRSADVVQSVRAYRRLEDLPEQVDLAVIVVPRDQVLGAVDECARCGVKALVVISAGFGETGAEGLALQDELLAPVRRAGMRMVGPNCLGILSTEPGFELNASFAPTWPPAGNVAFSSQSGALGLAVLDYARTLGIGISQFVSVGNRADVSGNDLLEHWETDPRTRVILLYLESFGNPRRFMEIARRVSRRKPIVAVKSGRSAAGARAAGSHTGALATMDVATGALLGQAGVIRTDTIEQLFDVAVLLANQPVPAGNRLAIVTNAGGPGIMAADACETNGLALPLLADATVQALRRILPPEASLKNPIDMIASASPAAFEGSLRLILQDEAIDAVLVLYVPPLVTNPGEIAAAIRRATEGATKPVLTCLLGDQGIGGAWATLRDGHLPVYRFPENAVMALGRAARHGRWLARAEGRRFELRQEDVSHLRTTLGASLTPAAGEQQARWLEPDAVQSILSAYGIRTPGSRVALTEEAAVGAAEEIGFPVALKISSPTIIHKTEVGGVALDLRTASEVSSAFRALTDRLMTPDQRKSGSGVVIQKMIGGIETFVGLTEAKDFGTLIAFGMGGTDLELQRDVVFRVNPITDLDAGEMLAEVRGSARLTGFRGSPGADRPALIEALQRTSRLAEDFPEIIELDLNPLIALPPGQGVIAVDARIRVRR